MIPLDGLNGPTLTIEGRDAAGNPRGWYVRIWNYAVGSPTDAAIRIDFDAVAGGFLHPSEADPVFAGDIDRIFISLVAPAYATGDNGPLDAPVEGWAELTGIGCEGPGSVLKIGDVAVPEHGLRIANGYDDTYNLTPERTLRNMVRLGYRGTILHYVGMSHYFRLERDAGAAAWIVSSAGGVLNAACAAWHRDFAARALALGYSVIWSLSYEVLDAHNRPAWKQRAADGSVGLTGWDPPSSLLSPANAAAMGPARAFRLRDPFDSWSGDDATPSPTDEVIGTGDGIGTGFALVKDYGGRTRRITRPVPGSVRVAVDGVETTAFSLAAGGVVALDLPPADGAEVTAGFAFDVAVRFAEDRLSVNRATFLAGAAPSVPLIEVREA